MKLFFLKHKAYWRHKEFMSSVVFGTALLVISIVTNFYAGIYATEMASAPVTDIVLSNIRLYDVDAIFIYGPLVLWFFVTILCLRDPKRIPFILKNIALFVLIRSVFIVLTHVGPFPDQASFDYTSEMIKNFTFGGDLFFSAHTGLPFLMALVFWNNIRLRVLFIATSVMFGIVVLAAHLHYSIDVLSAFFITYTIFHIAEIIFKKDRDIFFHGI